MPTANKSKVSVKVVFEKGTNPFTNKKITKVKYFNNISESATDERIFQAIQAITELQLNPVIDTIIERR